MLDKIRSLTAYKQVLAEILDGVRLPGLGLPRSARLPLLTCLAIDLNRPILFLTDRSDRGITQIDELSFWSAETNARLFPEPTPLFYEPAAWGTTTRRDRLLGITSLAAFHIPGAPKPSQPPLLVAPVRALMTRTLPRRDFLKATRILRPGQQIQPHTLIKIWIEIGYESVDTVLAPGQFSRRGGLLDIWPPAEEYPIRLDFFGDEIDTLRTFDPASQRTIERLDRILFTPAREVLLNKEGNNSLIGEQIDEFYIPIVHPLAGSLIDYLPQQAFIVVDDLDNVQATAQDIEEQSLKLRQDSISEGTLSPDFPVPYLSWSELQDRINAFQWIELGRTTAPEISGFTEAFSPGPRFGGKLKSFLAYLVQCCRSNEQVKVVSRQAPRLRELWAEEKILVDDGCNPEFIEGTLGEGWTLTLPNDSNFHLMTDSEVFGWERPKPRPRRQLSAEAPESGYADLRSGDWVVHIDYGVGRYMGLVSRILEGTEREYLCIEYEGGDQLFVPVHQADRLSRYIGPDSQPPSPTRLGTGEWTASRQRAREAVLVVAQDLLELYAQRQLAVGYSFKADSVWQQELEASFPYMETEDQMRAIQEVKKDMQNRRPMDRLLCGDVGYGKTEVALRAAFKAVMDGKQVAVLVPTTVLAQQHYDTFCQRLAAYPVEVEMLSRFRSPKEQDAILKRLSTGSVDIVIGTHRLVSQDVQFKDLGLVIIDEEQRFGVTHKEHLKKLRKEVDVLTLTATPIPRTLYMALTGVRDISTINTPPEERLPIVTHVGPYSPRLVRQAILREMERGGQVFFVHNRVQTIHGMERHLNQLVPDARVGIAHGQMHESELASVMHRFTNGEIDVLLSTSIIESGLDIPNANTLIVDRGDTFGLAQLYQLRGRVGRGAQRAYAYFFRHRKILPTLEGLERLEVIAENTQLGAGYSIAMRDLEMRGAGELLGTRQHGYIASVGFHLYTRLLAQAVRDLRSVSGLPEPALNKEYLSEIQLPVAVELPLAVGIPQSYVPDQNIRLQLYRRLADSHNEEELDALMDEFWDRFGTLPETTCNLFFQMHVKILAEQAGLASINIESEQIVLRYPPLPPGVTARNLPTIGFEARSGKNAYWLPMNNNGFSWHERMLGALKSIISI